MRRLPPHRALLLVFVVLLAAALPARAESLLNSVVFRVLGSWKGEGVFEGTPTRVEVTWAPMFDGRFLRVNWQTSLPRPDGTELRLEGEGTITSVGDDSGRREGTWLDSQGARRVLVARAAGDSLSTEWRNDEGVRGRTTYRMEGASTMHVRDEVNHNDTWRTVSVITLARAPATPH